MSEGITTPYDDLPLEVRREYWGWFGEPWPSFICYDEDGRLTEEMRKEFPAGEECLYCETLFDPEKDSGRSMPFLRAGSPDVIRNVHKECFLRQVLGGPEHLTGHTGAHAGMSYREEALWVWRWVGEHGVTPVRLPGSQACAGTRTERPARPPRTRSGPRRPAPGP